MKYLFINDLNFIKKNIKTIILFIIILNLYPLYLKFTINYNFTNTYLNIFFSNIGAFQKINSLYNLSILLLILNGSIFLVVTLISKDFMLGSEYLFLRINKKSYFRSKVFELIIITCLYELLLFFILYFTYTILGAKIILIDYFIYFLCDIICKCILNMFILIIYLIFRKYSVLILNLIIIGTTIGKISFLGYIFFSSNYILSFKFFLIILLLFLLLYIFAQKIFIKKYNYLFERSEHYGN